MKFLRFYILYRLYFVAGLLVAGIFIYRAHEHVTAILFFVAAFISLLLYFMLGTMRIVQEAVQENDMDNAIVYLSKIKYPKLLLKPVRSAFYMLQSNVALVNNDFEKAEADIRKSMDSKSTLLGDTEGMSYLQLATISLQKGNNKEARTYFLQAIKFGLPDKENQAAAYLQLSGLEIQRGQNKMGKIYFGKAKDLKPKTAQLKDQIAQMDKYMSRLQG
jgi:tetratricopeptide (TPR) repeat protein